MSTSDLVRNALALVFADQRNQKFRTRPEYELYVRAGLAAAPQTAPLVWISELAEFCGHLNQKICVARANQAVVNFVKHHNRQPTFDEYVDITWEKFTE